MIRELLRTRLSMIRALPWWQRWIVYAGPFLGAVVPTLLLAVLDGQAAAVWAVALGLGQLHGWLLRPLFTGPAFGEVVVGRRTARLESEGCGGSGVLPRLVVAGQELDGPQTCLGCPDCAGAWRSS